jgi:hypothetical protein
MPRDHLFAQATTKLFQHSLSIKRAQENPTRPESEEPSKIGPAHRQRKPAEIVAVYRKDVEGAELHKTPMLGKMVQAQVDARGLST